MGSPGEGNGLQELWCHRSYVVAVELPPKPIMTNDECPELQPDKSRSKAAQLVSYVLGDWARFWAAVAIERSRAPAACMVALDNVAVACDTFHLKVSPSIQRAAGSGGVIDRDARFSRSATAVVPRDGPHGLLNHWEAAVRLLQCFDGFRNEAATAESSRTVETKME
jgi:hypothetical protein